MTSTSETIAVLGSLALGLALALATTPAHAAPCCGGGSAAPAMISGDDQAQLTLGSSFGNAIGETHGQDTPIFFGDDYSERRQVTKLDAAILVSDRWQLGASVPFVQQQVTKGSRSDSTSRPGDVRVDLAFEAFPELGYSEWKPRGFIFLQATVPSGRSRWESMSTVTAADVTGGGLWTVSAGSLLVKKWSLWDAYLLPELHEAFGREFEKPADPALGVAGGLERTSVGSGFGGSLAMGLGVSPAAGPVRLGLSVQPVYEASKEMEGTLGNSMQPYRLSWDTSLELSWLAASDSLQ